MGLWCLHTSMSSLSLNKINEVYFDKLFVEKGNNALTAAIKGRVLLVDSKTMPIVAMSYTQSQLLQHELILVEMIENIGNLSTMKHLNCVVYISPTKESIDLLCTELALPHYNHYQLFFNNTVLKPALEKIAVADEYEVLSLVVELYHDYSVVNDNLFSIAAPEEAHAPRHNAAVLESTSLLSLLLALKKAPVIKYDPSSLDLKRLASEVLYYINSNSNNNLFDELNKYADVPPVLVIVDRRADPITPLVSPWTYQSMIHELVGINRNVVRVLDGKEQITLSETQDAFYREAMYLNYGDLTDKFQKYVDDYKKQTKQSSLDNLKTQDLTELKKILTRFPEYKKLLNNILKHLNIISEIDKQISRQNLWAVGELQQTILCELESQQAISTKLTQLLQDPAISTDNKVKLVILYVSKFDHSVDRFVSILNEPAFTNPPPTISQLNIIRGFMRHFGGYKKLAPRAANQDNNIGRIFNSNRIKIQQLFHNNNNTNVQGSSMPKTDNIYMQYIPKLNELLTLITKPATLQQQNQPNQRDEVATLVPDVVKKQYGNVEHLPVEEIVIYFKGGVTFEEARLVHELAAFNPRIKYVIGSDGLLNSSQWLEKMSDVVNGASSAGEPTASLDRKAALREIL